MEICQFLCLITISICHFRKGSLRHLPRRSISPSRIQAIRLCSDLSSPFVLISLKPYVQCPEGICWVPLCSFVSSLKEMQPTSSFTLIKRWGMSCGKLTNSTLTVRHGDRNQSDSIVSKLQNFHGYFNVLTPKKWKHRNYFQLLFSQEVYYNFPYWIFKPV